MRITLAWIKYFIFAYLGVLAFYLVAALIFEGIIIGEKKAATNSDFLVYVSFGEIHTEFIFPVKNQLFDWSGLIPIDLVTDTTISPQYIAIGWGSKDFFYNMPTWEEIRWNVVLKALFLPSESALHVEYLEDLSPTIKLHPLRLSKKDYLDLVSFVSGHFVLDAHGKVQKINDYSNSLKASSNITCSTPAICGREKDWPV